MSAVNVLLFWLRAPSNIEAMRLRRLDGIRGHRLDWSSPTVPVFSGRKKTVAHS